MRNLPKKTRANRVPGGRGKHAAVSAIRKEISGCEVGLDHVRTALKNVRAVLPITPLTYAHELSDQLGRDIYFKWDNKFRTGSFKERGAVNRIAHLAKQERVPGICAASAGNHALALSHHAARVGIRCSIVMPRGAPLVKIQQTRDNGARVLLEGTTFAEAYQAAQQLAAKEQLLFVPGFDDPDIIAGQGTAALEIIEQCPNLDSIVVPIGGGGLIAGIALAAKSINPKIFILGVRSQWSVLRDKKMGTPPPLYPALRPTTIADGIALSLGVLTRPYIERYVNRIVAVSEAHIASAIMAFLEYERTVIEGAGAAALAAVLNDKLPSRCKRTVIMACGSNIDMNVLSRLIERNMGECGRVHHCRVSVPDRPGALHTATGILAHNGANILEALHDRSFSSVPGNVDITFVVEVENPRHYGRLKKALSAAGITMAPGGA